MSTPYQRGFRKIAALDELPPDEPKLYRTGGASILLLRSRFGVHAVDATGCVGVGEGELEWAEALRRPPIPAETHAGDVWVCVDFCRIE